MSKTKNLIEMCSGEMFTERSMKICQTAEKLADFKNMNM